MLHSTFNKMQIDEYLRQLGKKYQKMGGVSYPAEIIIMGGASSIINYNFREVTQDVDALILASGALKDAIKEVARENNINDNWLNDDAKFTSSFSDKIRQYSSYYKTYYNCLFVRTISQEYLIATKLISAREYKSDISDIIGIFRECLENNNPLTYEKINNAVNNLYGSWSDIDDYYKETLIPVLLESDYDQINNYYNLVKEMENNNKQLIINNNIKSEAEVNKLINESADFIEVREIITNKNNKGKEK